MYSNCIHEYFGFFRFAIPRQGRYNENMKRKKCELLAPAGGTEQLIAAVENGADAVYLGGRMFNARANAGNFSDEEMREAIDFAHRRNVKIHVTMNTLLKDEELKEALSYAAFLYEAGADALIIQDLGLAGLIRQFMPDLPLHFSTQGTVTDLQGVEAATRLGFDRGVLARELSLAEIRGICAGTETEIEVFAHGALCVCYSGQCQLSRYFGGRSGNRGACAQPCRLPYATKSSAGDILQTFPYPLSPKDMCLIDHLGDLIEAGVTSFKLEGRMKSPEYVGTITRIYRKYLDLYEKNGSYQVSQEDRLALAQIFNRGGFTDEYLAGREGDSLMSGEIPKHQGIEIGHVIKRGRSELLDAELTGELSLGDGVEIRGGYDDSGETHGQDRVNGNIVTYYQPLGGKRVRIGDIRGEVRPGDQIYKISSARQLADIRKTWQGITLAGGPSEKRRVPVQIRVIGKGTAVTATASLLGDRKSGVSVTEDFVPAEQPCDLERLAAAMKKTGATPYTVESLQIDGSFAMAMKVSEMNGLRRRVLEALSERLAWHRERPFVYYDPLPGESVPQAVEYYYMDWESFRRDVTEGDEQPGEPANGSYDRLYVDLPRVYVIPVSEYEKHFSELSELDIRVVPYVSNVARGREEAFLEEHFDSIASHCRESGIYVGTLGWIAPFRAAGVPVYADYGLNVYNQAARDTLSAFGVRFCADSLECMTPGNGRYPLMTLQHEPAGDVLETPRREPLRIVRRPFSDQTVLAADCPDASAEPFAGDMVRIYR